MKSFIVSSRAFYCLLVVWLIGLSVFVLVNYLRWQNEDKYYFNDCLIYAWGASGLMVVIGGYWSKILAEKIKAKDRFSKRPNAKFFDLAFSLSVFCLASAVLSIITIYLYGQLKEDYLVKYIVFIQAASIATMVCGIFLLVSQIRKRKLAGKPEDGSGKIMQEG